MTRFIVLTLTTICLLTALTACAPAKKAPLRVKCPVCGYEFDVPQQ